MNAWLITWDWCGEHAAVTDRIAAILGARKSESKVAELVEFIYMHSRSSVGEIAHYANRPSRIPFKAQRSMVINGVPHGERIICGNNPWLYARKVSDLNVHSDPGSDIETISWMEPPTFGWKNGPLSEIVRAKEPTPGSIQRTRVGGISWLAVNRKF